MEEADHDHAYTHTTYDQFNPAEYTLKLSQKEVEDFVRLRVSNKFLFTGRRNSRSLAWRPLLKHMGLHQKMTHSQASKKWENLKRKYKDLKNPPLGVKVFPDKWPHFTLMDDAMTGRLDGSAPVLAPSSDSPPHDNNNTDVPPPPPVSSYSSFSFSGHKRKHISTGTTSASPPPALRTEEEDRATEVHVVLNGDNGEEDEEEQEEERAARRRGTNKDVEDAMRELESERALLDSERAMVESERRVLEREKQVLERERTMLEREFAMLDRERASVEREKATLEREKAAMEREKTALDRDRVAVAADRSSLPRRDGRSCCPERREKATVEETAGCEEDGAKDCEAVDRKERFLMLFENLIENF